MVALVKQPNMWHEPITVQRGDVWQLGKHRLYCGDSTNAEDVARLMHGEKADLIFADPPYGIGIDAWDTAIPDVPAFIELITSHLKQGGFFAFTHQMPYMVDWLYTLKHSQLRYKDHVAWVKRVSSNAANPLLRTHESLFIYSLGVSNYYITKGRYSDIRLSGLLYDLLDIKTLERRMHDLEAKAKGTPWQRNSNFQSGHEAFHHTYNNPKMAGGDLSPEFVNFTSVWSFLPENKKQHKGNVTKHATAKPLLLMNRLLELCTPENALVYDAFLGSGTTLISAENTNRTVYGMELSETYCASIIERWQEATGQKAQRVEVAV